MIQKRSPERERIMAAVNELFIAIGEDPQREGLQETPRRIADMYAEIFGGLQIDPAEYLNVERSEARRGVRVCEVPGQVRSRRVPLEHVDLSGLEVGGDPICSGAGDRCNFPAHEVVAPRA